MTCIIGTVDGDGNICIAADSSAVDSNIITPHLIPKVFKRGEFAIGYCHSFRLGQIVEHFFEPPPIEDGLDEDGVVKYMITEFIPELRGSLEFNDYPTHDDEKESWSLMVGIRGSIFVIESDFHLGYDEMSYNAIGAGTEYALGAMFASNESGRKLAQRGMEAAAKFCPYVIAPFNYVEV